MMNQRERNALDRHITGNYGEDSVADEPTDPVECEYHEVTYQRGEGCPECLRLDADGEPRYQRKVNCPRCGVVTNYDPTYGDLCPRHIRADNE